MQLELSSCLASLIDLSSPPPLGQSTCLASLAVVEWFQSAFLIWFFTFIGNRDTFIPEVFLRARAYYSFSTRTTGHRTYHADPINLLLRLITGYSQLTAHQCRPPSDKFDRASEFCQFGVALYRCADDSARSLGVESLDPHWAIGARMSPSRHSQSCQHMEYRILTRSKIYS